MRVTAQLVDADDGHQLWSKRFDRELSDVFAIQDEIAATIVNELRSGLTGAPVDEAIDVRRRGARRVPAGDVRAEQMDGSSRCGRAIVHFRDGHRSRSRHRPGLRRPRRGSHLALLRRGRPARRRESVPQARSAVERALELDPALADAHKVRALIAMNHDWDRRGAEEGLTRALELRPGSAAAHLWNAWRLVLLERQHDQALIELEAGRAAGPARSPGEDADRLRPPLPPRSRSGHRAVRDESWHWSPRSHSPTMRWATPAPQRGQYDRAFAEFAKAIELGGRSVNHIAALGYAYGRSGDRDKARELLQELTAQAAQRYVSPMWIALIHLGLCGAGAPLPVAGPRVRRSGRFLDPDHGRGRVRSRARDRRFTSLLARMGLGHLASRPA